MRSPRYEAHIVSSLGRFCEPNPLLAVVKDGMVGSHENIAQDPERATRRRDVQSYESTDALGSRSFTNLQDILFWLQRKLFASNGE